MTSECCCVQPQDSYAWGVLAAGIFTSKEVILIITIKMFVNVPYQLGAFYFFPWCTNQVQVVFLKTPKQWKCLLNSSFVPSMRQILESILKLSWINIMFPDQFHWLITAKVKCTHLPSVSETPWRFYNFTRCKCTPQSF